MLAHAVRTDIHRPGEKSFDPQMYEYCNVWDLQPERDFEGMEAARRAIAMGKEPYDPYAELTNLAAKAGYTKAPHQKWGRCGHCGAYLRYAALMLHKPTHTWILVGETCLGGRFSMSKDEFQLVREEAAERRRSGLARLERAERMEKLIARDPRLAILGENGGDPFKVGGQFLAALANTVRRWDLSEKQIVAAIRCIDEWEAREKEKAEKVTMDAPEGKQTITGTVKAFKEQITRFGSTWKMIVEDDRGFAVWVTEPRGSGAEVGDRVTLTCTLTRSERDSTFAFGKRPTQFAKLQDKAANVVD